MGGPQMRTPSLREANRRSVKPRVRAGSAQVQDRAGTALSDQGLNSLAGAWTRIGVLFAVAPEKAPVDLEVLICQTAQAAIQDERLFVCAASWLATYHG